MKKEILLLLFTLVNLTVIFGQNWHTDFQQAKDIAMQEHKPIILVFQGSDWCAPCIKLDREIWSTDKFVNYSTDHFVLLQADFPRKKKNGLSESQVKANAELAETYNKRGVFPFVVVLNHKGDVLGETGYKKMTPESYINEINRFIK